MIQSINPAQLDEIVGEVVADDAAAVGAAVERARAAQIGWRELGIIRRGRILRACADEVARRAEDLARLMTLEEGKTIGEARGELEAEEDVGLELAVVGESVRLE